MELVDLIVRHPARADDIAHPDRRQFTEYGASHHGNFGSDVCGCKFNVKYDPAQGRHDFKTWSEAKAERQTNYDAAPWLVRLYNTETGEISPFPGYRENDPWVADMLANGWVNLHNVDPTYPARHKIPSNPGVFSNAPPAPKVCEAHKDVGHRPERLAAVFHETNRREIAKAVMEERTGVRPENSEFVFEDDRVPGVEGARVLRIPFLPQDRNAVLAALNLQFGPGQVR